MLPGNSSIPRMSMLGLVLAILVVNVAQPIQLCGPKLADVLSLVCGHRGGFRQPQMNGPSSGEDGSGLKRVRWVGPRRGVADECCHQQCSFHTLVSYCASTDPLSLSKESHLQNLMTQVVFGSRGPLAPPSPLPQGYHRASPNLGFRPRTRPFFIVINTVSSWRPKPLPTSPPSLGTSDVTISRPSPTPAVPLRTPPDRNGNKTTRTSTSHPPAAAP